MYCFYKSSEVACFFRFVAEIRIDGWLILSQEGLRTGSFPRTKTEVILFSSALDLEFCTVKLISDISRLYCCLTANTKVSVTKR